MSLLPNATNYTPDDVFFVKINASTINVGSISTGTVLARQIVSEEISSISAQFNTVSSTHIYARDIFTSTISSGTLLLDGNTLTTGGASTLYFNGYPIATVGNISSIAEWSLDPAIHNVEMCNYSINGANAISAASITATSVDVNFATAITLTASLSGSIRNLNSSNIINSNDIMTNTLEAVGPITAAGGLIATSGNFSTVASRVGNFSTLVAPGITTSNLTLSNLSVSTSANFAGSAVNFAAGINSTGPANFNNNSLDNVSRISSSGTGSLPITGGDISITGSHTSLIGDRGLDFTGTTQTDVFATGGLTTYVNIDAKKASSLSLAPQSVVDIHAAGNAGYNFPFVPYGGRVSISADAGGYNPFGIYTGLLGYGQVDITAHSFTNTAPYVAGQVKLSGGSCQMYAGAISPIFGLFGYNYIYGNLGNVMGAGVPPGFIPAFPGTNYIYGASGTSINNGLYTDNIFSYGSSNLNITAQDGHWVDIRRVQYLGMGNNPVLDGGSANGIIQNFSSIAALNIAASNFNVSTLNASNISTNKLAAGFINTTNISIGDYSTLTSVNLTINANIQNNGDEVDIYNNLNLLASSNINITCGGFVAYNRIFLNGTVQGSRTIAAPRMSTFGFYVSSINDEAYVNGGWVSTATSQLDMTTYPIAVSSLTGISSINGAVYPTPPPATVSTFNQLYTSSINVCSINATGTTLNITGNHTFIQPQPNYNLNLTTTGVANIIITSDAFVASYASTIIFGDLRYNTLFGQPYAPSTFSNLYTSSLNVSSINGASYPPAGAGGWVSTATSQLDMTTYPILVSSLSGVSTINGVAYPPAGSGGWVSTATSRLDMAAYPILVSSLTGVSTINGAVYPPPASAAVSTFNQVFTSSLAASTIGTRFITDNPAVSPVGLQLIAAGNITLSTGATSIVANYASTVLYGDLRYNTLFGQPYAPSTFSNLYTSSLSVSSINGAVYPPPATATVSTFNQLYTSSLNVCSINATGSPLNITGNHTTIQPQLNYNLTLQTTGAGNILLSTGAYVASYSSTIVFGDLRYNTLFGEPYRPSTFSALFTSSLTASTIVAHTITNNPAVGGGLANDIIITADQNVRLEPVNNVAITTVGDLEVNTDSAFFQVPSGAFGVLSAFADIVGNTQVGISSLSSITVVSLSSITTAAPSTINQVPATWFSGDITATTFNGQAYPPPGGWVSTATSALNMGIYPVNFAAGSGSLSNLSSIYASTLDTVISGKTLTTATNSGSGNYTSLELRPENITFFQNGSGTATGFSVNATADIALITSSNLVINSISSVNSVPATWFSGDVRASSINGYHPSWVSTIGSGLLQSTFSGTTLTTPQRTGQVNINFPYAGTYQIHQKVQWCRLTGGSAADTHASILYQRTSALPTIPNTGGGVSFLPTVNEDVSTFTTLVTTLTTTGASALNPWIYDKSGNGYTANLYLDNPVLYYFPPPAP